MRGIKFMNKNKTLISLALFQTNWEESQKDYVDMLIPFVLYSISNLKENNIVSITDTRNNLKNDFGIDLYNNVIEMIFKRLSSSSHYQEPYLVKKKNIYYKSKCKIDIKLFEQKREHYAQNQNEVVKSFYQFLNNKNLQYEKSKAEKELISYLCKYAHNLLKDNISIKDNTIWTKRIGEFVEFTYEHEKIIFNYLKDISKGGMLATVYLNSNYKIKSSKKFSKTEVYFDTPLLMHILNYSGEALQKSAQELLDLLLNNGATVCAFEHNLSELEDILNAYTIRYRNGSLDTSYNFDYLIENDFKPEKIDIEILSLRTSLFRKKIIIKDTPSFDDYWKNIGFSSFDNYLSEKIHYNRSDRRDNDIESIASIYRLRSRELYHKYETCEALFVATNSYLVYHTQKYFREEENKKGIPAIVDDIFLTSLLWLKYANYDDTIPTLQLIADAYAAQEPSKNFWDELILKIDELSEQGEITQNELMEVKYGLFSKKNMFDVTEGDATKINHDTVKEVQRLNFLEKNKEIEYEKNQAIKDKENAIKAQNDYKEKYENLQMQIIVDKSKPYLKKIKKAKKRCSYIALLIISIFVYISLNLISLFFGGISSLKFVINLGITSLIGILYGIMNQFTNKIISKQVDKVSNAIYDKYLNNVYKHIKETENIYYSEITNYIKNELKKTP